MKQLKQEKAQNLPWLQREHNIGSEQIDALYQYAKFQFDCGNYSEAAEFLYHYRTLSTNSERNLSALWGKLAAEILLQDWETAMDSLTKLKSVIDDNNFAPLLVQLQQRTWLMHWSLFVFFNHENGRNAIIDLFFQERYVTCVWCSVSVQTVATSHQRAKVCEESSQYIPKLMPQIAALHTTHLVVMPCHALGCHTMPGLPLIGTGGMHLMILKSNCATAHRFLNAIQTNAQHLVRYLAVAAVVNKRRRNVMKDLMRLIEQESYQVSDPVTDFLQCLFTNYDFDGAQEKLQECEQVPNTAQSLPASLFFITALLA